MSAPNFRGFYKTGDMNVLSITRMDPLALQSFATPAISVHFIVGLVGDSIQTIRVFFLKAAFTLLKSHMSIISNSILV
jgi:hypothetical protein